MQRHVEITTIDEMARSAAKTLRCQLQTFENFPRLTIRNFDRGMELLLTVFKKSRRLKELSLTAELGIIDGKTKKAVITLIDIEHLYVTWAAPRMVSFCFLEGARFHLINISAEADIQVTSNIDHRRDEPEDLDEDIRNQRRMFYHIGKLTS